MGTPTCYRESCEEYCNAWQTEPCTWRRAKCRGSAFGSSHGRCDCSSCPGRRMTKAEMWQKNCAGKCGASEFCYFEGITLVGGEQMSNLTQGGYRTNYPRCAPCILTYGKDPNGQYWCAQ